MARHPNGEICGEVATFITFLLLTFFKRLRVRLLQSVMNMMHVISIPYSLMKVNPLSWIQKVCQYKGQRLAPSPPHPAPPIPRGQR